MADVLLCLSFAPDVSGSDALSDQLPGVPSQVEVAMRLGADALPALAHVATMSPDLPEALVTCREDEAVEVVRMLDPHIDKGRSRILGFKRHAILPGRDTIRLYFGLRRLDRLSLAAFHDYWLNHHADFGRRLIPPYTYHQLHAEPEATRRIAAETDLPPSSLDGVVEVHFPDLEALVRQLSREEVAREALEDERNFIDHARSEFWAYRELA